MKATGEAKIPQSPNLSLHCLKLKPNAIHDKHNKGTEQVRDPKGGTKRTLQR